MKIGILRLVTIKVTKDISSILLSKIQSIFGPITQKNDPKIYLALRLDGMKCSVSPMVNERRLVNNKENLQWTWHVVPEQKEMWLELCATLTLSLHGHDSSVEFAGNREWINARVNHLISIKRWIRNYGTLGEDGYFRMSIGMKYYLTRTLRKLPSSDHKGYPLATVTDGFLGQSREVEVFSKDGGIYTLANISKMVLAWMHCCNAERNRPYANYNTQIMERNARFVFKYPNKHLIIKVDDSTLSDQSLIIARLGKFEYVGFIQYYSGFRDGEYSGYFTDIGTRRYYPDGTWE
jgi:hypothetical protein